MCLPITDDIAGRVAAHLKPNRERATDAGIGNGSGGE
jgi:hypothetical protein